MHADMSAMFLFDIKQLQTAAVSHAHKLEIEFLSHFSVLMESEFALLLDVDLSVMPCMV